MKDYNGFSGEERMSSYNKLKYLQKTGSVEDWQNKPCEICGLNPGTNMAHQENYSNPREYYTLCVECHMKLHNRFSQPLVWLKHLQDVKNGYISKVYKNVMQYFAAQKKQDKEDLQTYSDIIPSNLGGEWFHKLAMQKINLNEKKENLLKYE